RHSTPAQRLALCAECHGADGSIPEADPEFVRFQATTLTFSRCFQASDGRLECSTCHDPHRDLGAPPSHYIARCLRCHTPPGSKPAGDFVAKSICPVNPRDDCLRCHMPVSRNAVPHTDFTDHHIRVHRQTAPKAE